MTVFILTCCALVSFSKLCLSHNLYKTVGIVSMLYSPYLTIPDLNLPLNLYPNSCYSPHNAAEWLKERADSGLMEPWQHRAPRTSRTQCFQVNSGRFNKGYFFILNPYFPLALHRKRSAQKYVWTPVSANKPDYPA